MTFNDRTLNRIGQLPELTASAIDPNIDIVCVQEHRYHHSKEDIKYHDTGNGLTFVYLSAWKNSINTAIGVGILIGPRALKSLSSIDKIQARMMAATFNGNPNTRIIYHIPADASDETDLNAFYNELSILFCS